MSFILTFSKSALKDIKKHKKAGDTSILKKLQTLLDELMEHPYTGTGQPEILKHDLAGLHSRGINQKHRLIYSVEEQRLSLGILNAWGHYGEK